MGNHARITLRPRRLAICSRRRRSAWRDPYGQEPVRAPLALDGLSRDAKPAALRPPLRSYRSELYNGADAVLSAGRNCIGSTGAEFLRISKWSCGVTALPVCPDFKITCPL